MYDKGVVLGTPDYKFNGNAALKRADAIILLNRLFGIKDNLTTAFQDVKQDSYFAGAVGAASELGLVNGTDANTFNPKGHVRNLDYLVMSYRYLTLQKFIAEGDRNDSAAGKQNLGDVPGYAREAVRYFLGQGLIAQADVLRLSDAVTREEAVVLLAKLDRIYLNAES